MASDDVVNSVEIVASCETYFFTWNFRCIEKKMTAMSCEINVYQAPGD